MLTDIKKSVEEFDSKTIKGFTSEAAVEKISAQTGFGQIEPEVNRVRTAISKLVVIVNGFKPAYDVICQKVAKIKAISDKEIAKATTTQEKRDALKNDLKTAKDDLNTFKSKNKLSEADVESPLWGFGAIAMIVIITCVEMAISFSSLREYYDGYAQILGVNGLLGLTSSILVMFAGQMIKQRIRLRKELDSYTHAPATTAATLPNWVKEDSSVFRKRSGDGLEEYKQRNAFSIFLISSFIFLSSALTIIKFWTPLVHHSTAAYIVTFIVISSNLVFFVAYEYIQYSGLSYPMRIAVDKKLKIVSKIEEQIEKLGSESVDALQEKRKKQLDPLEKEFNLQMVKVTEAEQKLMDLSSDISNILEITGLFERKLNEAGFSVEFQKLKTGLALPQRTTYPNPF